MKRKLLLLFAMLLSQFCPSVLLAQGGQPYIRNYGADDYEAHKRNFDIVCGSDGIIYVANFEGLLYYDHAQWRVIHTPGISRITELFIDSEGTLWTGGYNFIGHLQTNANGSLSLRSMSSNTPVKGEVTRIWQKEKTIFFSTSDTTVYAIEGQTVRQQPKKELKKENLPIYGDDITVTQVQTLGSTLKAVSTHGNGLFITNIRGDMLYTVSEENGLCSNNVAHIDYDGHGTLWGATDNGLFALALPSPYTRFAASEGLRGEVLSIQKYKQHLYVGTLNGLYRRNGMLFDHVNGINHACWDLKLMNGQLLAATSNGIFQISADGTARQLTSASTTAIYAEGDTFISGELDGVYVNAPDGRHRLCDEEQVTRIFKDKNDCLWLQNIYGQIWKRKHNQKQFVLHADDGERDNASSLVNIDGHATIVGATDIKPFPYPLYSYTDQDGITWLTDNEGKHLYAWSKGHRMSTYDQLLEPLAEQATRAMFVDGRYLLIGSDNGLTIVDRLYEDPAFKLQPTLLIRSALLGGDSVLWGGSGQCPQSLPTLGVNDNNLLFTFGLTATSLLGDTKYRYRLNGGAWSTWSGNTSASFFNHPSGSYTLEVQARDAFGRLSPTASLDFSIQQPLYQRWYMMLLYLVLFVMAVFALMRYRLHRLEREKHRLETIVQERTAEVVKQKDEIEQQSHSLQSALDELSKAQHELIRQEKMATMFKLTQGLIDRILNPMNYINNFAKLSQGLLKDLQENIDEAKDTMDSENYEDTLDALQMLHSNLEKVGEHGYNATRTLKAMEEILKDRSGGIVAMDLLPLLQQTVQMVKKYYADEIAQYGIDVEATLPASKIPVNGNGEQLGKVITSMLANSVYAVVKKSQKQSYRPLITLRVDQEPTQLHIVLRDNGVGIETGIINKVFDPFFTTKTTGEASGVGLYLSREIVQNHGGDITVSSVKNEYCEFIITLPKQPS